MAENEGFVPNQLLDLDQIQQEAQHRWLRSSEICEILRNFRKFQLRSSPPSQPPAGSLFLFDRKVLRYFRKDGYRWRKKKDGKTVKEAHEKLKVNSVDTLHCYYAHGEDNENFQRRSYWMLDEQFENIVLVHYREVKEGYASGVSRSIYADSGSLLISSQSGLQQITSSDQTVQASYASDPVDCIEQTVSLRLEDSDSAENLGTSSLGPPTNGCLPRDISLRAGEKAGFLESDPLPGVDFMHEPKFNGHQTSAADFLSYKLTDARLDSNSQDVLSCGNGSFPDSRGVVQVHSGSQPKNPYVMTSGNCTQNGIIRNDEGGGLKKLDSFGRWMDKEMGGDCEDSLMASDSGNFWNEIDTANVENKGSSLSRHMQLNIDSVGPSLSQEQLFSICDFAPDWAYSGAETKVLISGTFLGDKKHSSGTKWCCMFGEIEVPAEVIMNNAIRCQVPSHAAGRVPFYITCSNRLACSEVREFEYLEKPSSVANCSTDKIAAKDESNFLIRLAKLLSSRRKRKWLDCSIVNCEKCKLKGVICSLESDKERTWRRITEAFRGNYKELLIQNLLKDKLYEWLLCEVHEACQGLRISDEKGQGVIHLAAALGYEWAIRPIAATGVSLNIRDLRGRTALHWASLYGREETVVALVKLGVFAGAVDDPTLLNPGGQTAADLASNRGHKGIAGYLAEADLTTHPSALSVNENITNIIEQHSLRGSLEAVRKSTHAASLIQDSFRVRSFRHRQLTTSINEFPEANDLIALGSSHKAHKTSHFEDYLHSAASRIQHKYRGWKGRNEFLKIRERVVKIQAHFRGHQVRKQYKKVVWCVGIVEKAILRWRRKSRGLRGFRMAPQVEEKTDDYDFLRIGRRQKYAGVEKALARVRSMARHPEARDQYMRLVSKFEKLSDEESNRTEDGS